MLSLVQLLLLLLLGLLVSLATIWIDSTMLRQPIVPEVRVGHLQAPEVNRAAIQATCKIRAFAGTSSLG